MVEPHEEAPTAVLPAVQPPAPGRSRTRAPRAPRPPRPPRPAPQGIGAVVATTSTMVTLVCVWAVLQLLVLSGVAHDREQTLLYADLRVQLAETTAPLGPEIAAGAPVAILTIPAIGVEEVVVEGTASGDLLAGPGHLRGTPLPGQRGFSVVMGRAATYGAPFAHLADLRRGDDVEVVTSQGTKTLEVIGVRHEGDPVPTFTDAQAAVVTFVSAEGEGGWLSALTPQKTLYVDAIASEAFPTPGGYGLTAPKAEQAMERDTSALPLLALWLALLVGLSMLVVLARQRWSAVLVWTIAGPAAISLAWVTTDTGMRLLPNLL